ncbi:MAG: TIGR04086 family membrane protein [Syntrophomonadaceae bacterium]|nr:TIGR04086 family membrane protein [Syntrophomonadaceae bacterium]
MDKIPSIELKALGKALVFSFVLCLLAAVIVYYSSLNETLFPTLGRIILISSIFLCGCQVSKAYGSKGLLRGVTMGLVSFIILVIATYTFDSSLIDLKSFIYTLCQCITAGGLGGILGIGLSEK